MFKNILVGLLFLFSFTLSAQTHYALVIGNSDYQELGSLRNPVNDANDMAQALRGLGFQVDLKTNASLQDMEEGILSLANRLGADSNSIGLFYYAGHGVQSDGINYLIPSDSRIPSESFLKSRSLSAQIVMDELGRSGNRLNTIILDACRDNPFSWSRSGTRGLSVVGGQPPGSIIVYATSSGSVAQDGQGRNGLFTSALLDHIATPGIDITEVFKRTGSAVQEMSNGQQIPAVYNQFFGDASFSGELNSGISQDTSSSRTDGISFTVEQTYGSMIVTTLSRGELYMDGQYMGQLSAGGRALLGDIPAGRHEVEIRYGEQNEMQSIVIRDNVESSVDFTWVEAPRGRSSSDLTGRDSFDSFQTAYDISFPTQSLIADFYSSRDQDYYRLTLPSHMGEQFITVKTTGDTDTVMELYGPDRNQELFAEDDDSGEGTNSHISFAAQGGETWWIVLRAYDGRGEYNLVVEEANPAAVVDEANVGFSTAFEVDLDDVISGYFSYNDEGDYFQIQIPRRMNGKLLRVYTDQQIDTELYIFDRRVSDLSDNLYYNDDSDGLAASVTFPVENGDRYYICLTAYEEGPYQIYFETIDAGDAPYESNDSFDAATPISLDERQNHDFYHSDDRDYLVFQVTQPGEYRIRTYGDSDTIVRLYSDSYSLIQEDDDSGSNYNSMIQSVLKPGTYYVEVEAYSGMGEYQIRIDQ